MLAKVIDGAAAVGGHLPASAAHRLALVGGHFEWAFRPRKRRRLAVNLAHAVGDPPGTRAVARLVHQEILNEARRSADLLWAIHRPAELLATIEIEGSAHAVSAAASGRGLVLAGVHLGGWEVGAAVPGAVLSVPTTVMAADNWLAWGIQHVRSAVGLRVLYRSDSAVAAVRLLQRGEALLVLGDDASGAPPRRHRVRFCDTWASLPTGIVDLARLSGAVILPFAVLPGAPRRWRVVVDAPIEPPHRHATEEQEAAVLQVLAERWSALIRANPAWWAASFPIAWEERP